MLKLLFILCSGVALWGQANANKGQITGTVYDANQAVIPNATVKIQNTATGLERELKTNGEGQYRAILLDPGEYGITVDSSGFAQTKIEGIVLNVGGAIGIDVVMQVQATTTTVEVGETLLNVALPAPSTTLSNLAITNLPINGRRFQDFAVLTPTVQVDPQRGQLSFVGQRGINSNIMLDGADYNQPFFGGIRGGERSNNVFTVPQSSIQEFQVVTSGYSAEYGRSTGGVLNTITKSGTNAYHGDLFYQLRHKELGAKDPVVLLSSLETQHQFGGSVGGPIKRDKLFFFGAVERQDASQGRFVQFPQIIGRQVTDANREALEFFRSEERPFQQTNDALAFTAKADYQATKGHRLTLRYNFSDAEAINAVSVGGSLSPATNRAFSNDGIEKDRTHTVGGQYTHIFGPAVVNDLRFTLSAEERPRLSNSELPQVSSVIGTFGARNFLPTTQDDKRWQIADALSVIRGQHTFKFGADLNFVKAGQAFGFNQFGAFFLAGSDVNAHLDILSAGGAIANRFDDRSVTYSRQIGNLLADMSMQQIAFYGQDSWRINNKLTLDFGLRWEGQYNPTAEANNNAVIQQVKGFRFPIGKSFDPSRLADATSQVMPRFGFAYTPWTTGKPTVIRGHAGIFYASTPLLWFAGPVNNFRLPPGDVSITLSPTATQTVYQQLLAAGVDLNRTPIGQLPVIPIETVQRASALALGGTARDPFAGAALLGLADDFKNPRSLQSGLGFETEVFRNFVSGVQFNYINTVHLGRNEDYNTPGPFVAANDQSRRPNFGLRSGVTRPLASLSSITVRASSARSMYRGLTFSSQYRAKKMNFGAHYTWSQAYSDDDTERDASGFNYMDLFNFRQDYSFSRIDIRHQFTSFATFTLPAGFEIGGTLRARSGLPINPTTGADTNGDFNNNDRPFSAPGVPLERNSFRNRPVVNNDLRVLKNFGLGDVKKIQFSVEFFNLLNLDNVIYSGTNGGLFGGVYGVGLQANGQTAPVDPRFMRLRLNGVYDRQNAQSGTPLQVQFGLRFFF